MSLVIEIQHLYKTYRTDGITVEALRGIDLQIDRGEFLAIMGPSGCGKSTLLHLLGGLDRATEGMILVCGQRIDALDESARAILRRQVIGFVFQAYNLIPNLTVADNVDLPGLLAGHRAVEVAKRRNELLGTLGIPEKRFAFPGELSGGQQQKVALARALINHPTVLLVDEPTGNLDTRSGAEVMNLLCCFNSQGQTIVLVTHDPKIASFAGRVVFMRDGQFLDEIQLPVPGDGAIVLSRLVELGL